MQCSRSDEVMLLLRISVAPVGTERFVATLAEKVKEAFLAENLLANVADPRVFCQRKTNGAIQVL